VLNSLEEDYSYHNRLKENYDKTVVIVFAAAAIILVVGID